MWNKSNSSKLNNFTARNHKTSSTKPLSSKNHKTKTPITVADSNTQDHRRQASKSNTTREPLRSVANQQQRTEGGNQSRTLEPKHKEKATKVYLRFFKL